MKPRIASILAVIALLALAAFVAGCGEKDETVDQDDIRQDRVTLLLDWTPNPNHAGIYQGIADGSFDKRALQVEVQTPGDAADIIKQVAAGRVDMGLTYSSYVLAAREQGAKIKAVGAIVPTPLNSIIWLKKSGLKKIEDLKGKTVATSGDGESSTLNTILQEHGVNPDSVKQINVNTGLQSALLSGKVDASITGYYNVEGVQLEQKNRPATVIPVDEAGSPTYNELVVVVKEDNLKDTRRREIFRRFFAGLQEGTENAVADPNAAFESLAKDHKDIQKDPDFNKASLKVTLPLLAQGDRGNNPFGFQDPNIWATYGKWMKDNGELTETGINYADAVDNSLLPGAGTGD